MAESCMRCAYNNTLGTRHGNGINDACRAWHRNCNQLLFRYVVLTINSDINTMRSLMSAGYTRHSAYVAAGDKNTTP